MYLKEALKSTGKATRVGSDDFVYIDKDGILNQDTKTDEDSSKNFKEFKAYDLLDSKWISYDSEQIIPSNGGEI